MTSFAALDALVTLAHADVLEDMWVVLFDPSRGMKAISLAAIERAGAARNRLQRFLGPDTISHLYCVTRNVNQDQVEQYRKSVIVAIASQSPIETIKDAYIDYRLNSG